MIPNLNLSEARTDTIEADGYVMKILDAIYEEKPDYKRVQLIMDISEGPKAGYYKNLEEKANFWGMKLNLYMDPKSAWKFVRFIDAVKASNEGFTWNDDGENDEKSLIGKYVGVVTRKKEYLGNDGVVKRKLVPYSTVPVDDIRAGNFTVPDMLPLQGLGSSAPVGVVDASDNFEADFGPINNEDFPF